jgi:DNA-binding response OmpR family regulator
MTTAPAPRVLVVDDEHALADLVAAYLTKDGLDVTVVGDGAEAVSRARAVDPDVVVLDLGLPSLDGIEVCRQLRTFTDCYVLMLTARSDEIDKLIGLSVGADDYMTKPFSPRELVARVRVLLRRPRAPVAAASGGRMRFGPLELDPPGRQVHLGGTEVALTRTEFDILAALAGEPNVVFTRRQLIDTVWGDNWVGDEHLVDVHIGHLRRKLGEDADSGRFIRTVRGVGYRMGDGR